MILKRHQKFATLASKIAKDIVLQRGIEATKHTTCAIIVKKNKVLAIALNDTKTDPKSKTRNFMRHAEFNAINYLEKEELKGADIIVVRIRRSGLPGLAKPCVHCQQLIKDNKIKNSYWSTTSSSETLELTNK